MANEAQIEHWNSEEASHWVVYQDRYDRMLAPFARRILAAAPIHAGSRVLDVGCGCGGTTIEAARRATTGTATGIDISEPMIETARLRAAEENVTNAAWLLGDAQTTSLPVAAFDVVISRFGIMFFDDPVAAFTNVARAISGGGALTFVCWQDLLSNEWIRVPGLALAEHVPLPDLGPPGAPGMFSLADPERIRTVLTSAGFTDLVIEPLEEQILLGGGGSLEDSVAFLRQGGMARAVLKDVEESRQEQAIAAAAAALKPFVTPEGVRIGTAAWLVSGRRL
jgi:SAM-dependent methyltransferase